jgi:hypothetical protein
MSSARSARCSRWTAEVAGELAASGHRLDARLVETRLDSLKAIGDPGGSA